MTLISKRKPDDRFVLHPTGEMGIFSDCEIMLSFDAARISDRATPENYIFQGAFAVSHQDSARTQKRLKL